MPDPDPMAIALARIAEEAEQKTGTLDLNNLGLATLPEALFELRHLRRLDLAALPPWQRGGDRPNRIAAQAGRLSLLTGLETLSISRSDLNSVDCVRPLTRLQSLDCSGTEVHDLAPLAGLTALQSLHCSLTQKPRQGAWPERPRRKGF